MAITGPLERYILHYTIPLPDYTKHPIPVSLDKATYKTRSAT